MITLTLLHPLQEIAVQSWTFQDKSRVRIGRAADNEVVLYSAVVSRYHVEIQKTEQSWAIINLGANGTYIDGGRIDKVLAVDGMVFRLAASGPKILIKLESNTSESAEERESDLHSKSKKSVSKSSKETLIN